MWMGSPALTASVAKTRRKSWGGVAQRLTVRAVQVGALEGQADEPLHGPGRDDAPLGAVAALEQVWQRRSGQVLVAVVAGDQGDVGAAVADAVDDASQDVGQLGGDQQQPFSVVLGRGDLQQRHDLAGVGQPVAGKGEVGEFQQLFTADPGVAQRLHDRPGPKRLVFVSGEIN
jgi:hypothetical protein